MGWIGATRTGPTGFHKPIVWVYIGGKLRLDGVLRRLTLRSGFAPSEARIDFPARRFPTRLLAQGTAVLVYVNPHICARPTFRGYIEAAGQTYEMGDRVEILALDERGHLNDDTCSYNYNEIDEETGLPKEALNSRRICSDIHDGYTDFQYSVNSNSDYLHFDTGAFPTTTVGPQIVFGMPHGVALEQVQRLAASDNRRRTYLRYAANTNDLLSSFRIGAGPVRRINYSVRNDLAARDQPYGYPTAERIQYRVDDFGLVNRLAMQGRRKRVQSTLTLTEAWDATIESAVLLCPPKYTVKQAQDGSANSDYTPYAAEVGRRYEIPTVSVTNPLTGLAEDRQPHVLGELLDDDPNHSSRKAMPFCLVKYADEGTPRTVMSGFTIKDNRWVWFSEPQAKPDFADGAAAAMITPDWVKLVCVYLDEARLETSDVTTGSYYKYRRQRLTDDGFAWDMYADGAYSVQADGSLSLISGDTDNRKDDAELEDWGEARLKELQGEDASWVITLPTVVTAIRLGDSININGYTLDDVAVLQIDYDFVRYQSTYYVGSN